MNVGGPLHRGGKKKEWSGCPPSRSESCPPTWYCPCGVEMRKHNRNIVFVMIIRNKLDSYTYCACKFITYLVYLHYICGRAPQLQVGLQ